MLGRSLLDGEKPKLESPPSAAALRILVVEDNRDMARTLEILLKHIGHEVEVRYTGRAAVEAATLHVPDVVLCDLGLPELDGFGVARALRRNPLTCAVRLIAISGYSQEEDQKRSRESGFDVHLVKPISLRELLDILRPNVEKTLQDT